MNTPLQQLWFAALTAAAFLPAPLPAAPAQPDPAFQVLVFSKTVGFRHTSIPNGIAAIRKLGEENGFGVVATEDSATFTPDELAKFQVVVFMSTIGDVLNPAQEAALQTWVEAGGGFAGVHAAIAGDIATEGGWPWYVDLCCATFKNHSAIVPGVVVVEDHQHPSTAHLPAAWKRTDEWYNFTASPRGRGKIQVLAAMDESTYQGGTMGKDHPIAWFQPIGKGRMWYTALGHTEESFTEPLMVKHLLGGIQYAAGVAKQVAPPAAAVPDNLVVEGVPAQSPALEREVGRYLDFRTAAFHSWHPQRREMLVATRFADSMQLHLVKTPGGARRQLSFLDEPVNKGTFQPKDGNYIVFPQDTGGSEYFQLYRLDPDGRITLLTDGKSRNSSECWADSGKQLAYSSTRRNGKDTDIYIMNPADPTTDRLVVQLNGGGWVPTDWSPDESQLLVTQVVSINESHLHLLDVASGKLTPLTPAGQAGVAWVGAKFTANGKSVFSATDLDSEFRRLVRLDLATGQHSVLTPGLNWDVEIFALSPDGKTLAYTANADGASALHLLDTATGAEKPVPQLPLGVLSGLKWHSNNRDLGFTLVHANSPADAYSLDVTTGEVTRWTESETGGLDAAKFRQPTVIRTKSFDGLTISAFVYRPDPAKFPGKRPAIIQLHGGPEMQSRPIFLGRNNYFLDELGVALVLPNVRGSAGYGKTFLALDNGFKREDSVKDMGAIIDWARNQPDLDSTRIAVTGGSYGGYMTLAALTHFSDRLKCGVDVVGISNFVTFLENTNDYRRDLRRVEYGDERDPAMRAHLAKISPTTNVKQIAVPLFVVQGMNDPRVPVTEAEQMVKALRDNGGTCWYLMAKDEGHGFQKKKNADFQFLSTVQFWQQHLLGPGA